MNEGDIEIRGIVSLRNDPNNSNKLYVILTCTLDQKILEKIHLNFNEEFYIKVSNLKTYSIYADFKGVKSRVFYIQKAQKTVFLSLNINN